MIGPRPVLPALVFIRLSVAVLPADARDRYREEFGTELCELPGLRQVGQAMSLAFGSFALRHALTARDIPVDERTSMSWKCRLGKHSYTARRDDNTEVPANTMFVCVRCGRYYEPKTEPEIDIDKLKRTANFLGGS